MRMTMRFVAVAVAAAAALSVGTAGAASNAVASQQPAPAAIDRAASSESVTPHAVQSAGRTYQGCPSGAVCVYPNASWNGGHPSLVLWSYGLHKISGQYGTKRFLNNQYGHADAWICKGHNGSHGTWCNYQWAQTYGDYNFTPINYIELRPSPA